MHLPPTRKTRNAERVRALLEAIRKEAGAATNGWLNRLEHDALHVRAGWRGRFDAWPEGLEHAQGVPKTVAIQWRREASACLSTEIRGDGIVLCALWSLLVTLSTLVWQSMLTSHALAITGCALIAATATIGAWRAGWLADPRRSLLSW